MLNKMHKLRREATRAMEARGHRPGPWINSGLEKSFCNCRDCGAQAVVIKHPAPNEIEIGGRAVAVYCAVTTEG